MTDALAEQLDGIKIEDSDTSKDPIFAAKDHASEFDPSQYLEGFYKSASEDTAMQVVLFFLPGVLYRLPNSIENVLDLGAGPTVYIPIAMRNRAQNIFTSDYAEANRKTLQSWIENKSDFDWGNVCKWILNIEASTETPEKMQADARSKMRGILEVNVHKEPVVQNIFYKVDKSYEVPKQFDVITTVFCLEYASETLEEYARAVKGAISLIKPGGYLVQGGVLHANEYSFGGKRFRCHYLTQQNLVKNLKDNGMCTEDKNNNFKLIIHEEIFILVSKKLA
uniref:NNMT/PNMT/TEMT family protein n=1 Tax=Panagrellus redivivus TaxID=6233 RepID=A0A7E4W558_PANRE